MERAHLNSKADGRRQRKIVQRERDRVVISVLEDPVYGAYSRVENELSMSFLVDCAFVHNQAFTEHKCVIGS
jgi:hypothetical protein